MGGQEKERKGFGVRRAGTKLVVLEELGGRVGIAGVGIRGAVGRRVGRIQRELGWGELEPRSRKSG